MRKISASKIKLFNKRVKALLDEHGFEKNTFSFRYYEYRKETKYGTLHVKIDSDSSYVFSVFAIFIEPDLAKPVLIELGGNTYSGKCNTHSYDMEEAIRGLTNLLNAIK